MKTIQRSIIIQIIFLLAISAHAQMKAPVEWHGYEEVFGVKNGLRHYDYTVKPIYTNTPANVLWPGENLRLTFQLTSYMDQPIEVDAQVHVIRYGTRGVENDVWWPELYAIQKVQTIPVMVRIAPNGYFNMDLEPDIPEVFGGYAVVFDLGKYGRQVGVSVVRSMKPSPVRIQYPKQSLDDLGVDFLNRVGVQAIRYGIPYCPTDFQEYQSQMRRMDEDMKRYKDSNITVLLMFGEGQANTLMPLGVTRPHLDEQGCFMRTKQDYAWLPVLDADFTKYVRDICLKHGWPAGPVTAVSLWNEPWEGASISGWQADMIRYREIYTAMADGVLEARRQGADVLIGGCDSNTNAWDKFFADGTMDMLPVFDFLSIHYQGMESPVLYPEWNSRKDHKGRVLIWDTESWVGNTDDRIGLVVATNRSAGYDRSMGIYGGYMYSGDPHEATRIQTVRTVNGTETVPMVHSAWSPAAALGAVQSLIGERDFKELLFPNGLPWGMIFDGYNADADDGTVVIAGDLGDAFGKENILFRNVKLNNGKMTVKAHPDFRLYDFYGNAIVLSGSRFEIPLTSQGYFLRTNGKKGSFDKLVAALKSAKIEGYAPVEIIAKDFIAPISSKPQAQLVITNILNRKIAGRLQVNIGDLSVSCPAKLTLNPHQTVTVSVQITGGKDNPENTYPLQVRFDAEKEGVAVHAEDLHVNLIHKRTITVDGRPDDWADAIPQSVRGSDRASVSLTETAWFPFKESDTRSEGFANVYLAYDDRYFYFAAKVTDQTPNKGARRFETRNDDDYFYPEISYHQTLHAMQSIEKKQQAANDNQGALLHPSEAGRIFNYLENTSTVQSIGIDLDLPTDRYIRTALYFPAINQPELGITVFDRETGKELLGRQLSKVWNGVYVILNLSGKIRIRCSTGGWRNVSGWRHTAKLSGIFFDGGPLNTAGTTSVRFVDKDFDTQGNWKSVYGNLGYYIVGLPPQLPQDIVCQPAATDDKIALKWPENIRRFSYRKNPDLPDASTGEPIDNILIAFNVLPLGQDGMASHPKGTIPRYTGYKCTDYEYALNMVAPEYGGGFEIWRLLVPGMPRKHFYPRQPKSPYDGAVKDGRLITVHEGNIRYTECAIPWTELPDVKKTLDRGETVKFSCRVNDDGAQGACLELARGRSVSKRNSRAFHPDFREHWANELEFGFEK